MLEEGLAGAIAFLVIYGVYFLATKVEENTERGNVVWHIYTALKSSLFGATTSLIVTPFFMAILYGIGLIGNISSESVGPYIIGGFFVFTAWFYRLEYIGRSPFQSNEAQDKRKTVERDTASSSSSAQSRDNMHTSRTKPRQSSGGSFDPDKHKKKCPDCAEYIKLEARVCRYCGHEYSEDEVERQIEEVKDEVREEKSDTETETLDTSSPQETSSSDTSERFLDVLGVVAIILIIALALAVALQ